MNILGALMLLAAGAFAWTCPACGSEQAGTVCADCGLPEVPAGMAYVPAADVVADGDTLHVGAFFIDSFPVVYRDVLPWLGENCRDGRVLASVITGQYNESGHFLAFTPFVASPSGDYTVPAAVMDRPAAGFTWTGADWFLSSRGLRLPTLAEPHSASALGIIQPFSAYSEMQLYSALLESSLGSVLGALSRQAMFAGFSTAEERVMWELTCTGFRGDPLSGAPGDEGPVVTLFKPLEVPVTAGAGRDMGYFNVVFRGAIDLPGFE